MGSISLGLGVQATKEAIALLMPSLALVLILQLVLFKFFCKQAAILLALLQVLGMALGLSLLFSNLHDVACDLTQYRNPGNLCLERTDTVQRVIYFASTECNSLWSACRTPRLAALVTTYAQNAHHALKLHLFHLETPRLALHLAGCFCLLNLKIILST